MSNFWGAVQSGLKNREGLFIVVCVKVAVNRLLLLGKIKTLGLIFSHETAGLLASFTTISKSPILTRTFISLRKNGEGLLIVVCVKVAGKRLLLQGKIETKAQFLAMRFASRSCWRPILLYQEVLRN